MARAGELEAVGLAAFSARRGRGGPPVLEGRATTGKVILLPAAG
ncbi:MAG TPA: hypothetical protein VHC97_13385 [Thermoanaerobaculia bacterium]|nr:hypothetical protein [Thermoanaerobaculia bacterium]